jgi:general secretion pathway protein E/type IV pilus assembly protein PilB
MGIYELMVTGEEVRHLAHENASTWDIKKAALRGGMTTLRMDGWDKTIRGVTSVDEVLRVTKGDREISLADFTPAIGE